MSDSLFDTTEGTPNPAVEPSPVDALATKLFSIKNEHGEPKYASLEKAVEALQHAQEYIPKLKTEKEQFEAEVAKLREELTKRATVEEVISRFTSQPSPVETPPTSEVPKAFDENAVREILQRELSQRDQLTVTQANAKLVATAMTGKYGDKAKEVIAAKATELGMTTKEMEQFAYSKPQAFLSWFNASAPASTGAPVRSTVHLQDAPPAEGLKHPGKSMLRGVSSKDQAAFMAQIKAEVYKKHGIDS